MYFNENKYRRCISHLINLKTYIVLGYIILLTIIGIAIGIPIVLEFFANKKFLIAVFAGIGSFLGLIIGLSSTWTVEMKIQEAYWKIDTLNELKNQTAIANKNTPVAKTVVAIENKQNPPQIIREEKKEEV